MNNLTVEQVETLYNKGLMPKADYTNLDSFFKTISDEQLGGILALCRSEGEEELEYISYIVAGLFMNEYNQDECTEKDLSNLFPQFHRQGAAEALGRLGVWDTSTEDRRLVPTNEPL